MPTHVFIPFQQRGRVLRALLLGLMLLLPIAQLGAALHALSHASHARAQGMATQDEEAHGPESSGAHACASCLAYAHIGAIDLPELYTPSLLTGLVFGLCVVALSVKLCASLPVLRNRGPPAPR